MGKVTKARKRSKTKAKKPSTKSKSKSSSIKKTKQISGAPENLIDNMSDNESTSNQSDIATFRLNRRIMKSHHIKDEEKAIRKPQRALNKAKKTELENEIEEAESMLEEAIAEKEDAAKWTHPEEAIDKLSTILNQQIENNYSTDIIEMTQELILRGADIVKVGIGPGSVCTTRIQTGVGYPQLSAVIECADAAHGLGAHIISDGGCTSPGDVAKAFGGGADFVMLGGMFAGHDEGGGTVISETYLTGLVVENNEPKYVYPYRHWFRYRLVI